MHLKEKINTIKEKLLDPFNVNDLEREFEELLNLMKNSDPKDILSIREDFEEVRKLLSRNLSIISGGLKPLLEREQGSIFSRRV
ncbi:MAG: hypothetical protein GXO18_04945 [Aquificae bacterium]|nr:hypothetical protein [Aquificota bacterium]